MIDLELEPIEESDVEVLTPIMKDAFDRDAQIHLGEEEGGPPGYNDGSFLRKYALNKKSQSFKVLLQNRIIGAIILWINENNINYLGNVFISPDLQNRGIGSQLWKTIEKRYPRTKEWRTDTPGFSKRNHNFYVNKCGFSIVKIENPGDQHAESYLMRKTMQ